MALVEYLAGEVREDCADGLISRREALRRLGLLGVSASVAGVLLASCGSDEGAGGATTTGTASAPTTGTASAPTTAAAEAAVDMISFDGPAGVLQGSFAAAPDPIGAVLIIHENRGLTQHFVDLPARFAESGYTALALDLLSRAGGTSNFDDGAAASGALGAASQTELIDDMRAGLDELARREPDSGLAIVGFCFGGGQVWNLLDAGEPRLAAAAPFYGPGPSDPDFSGSQAAVLGVYAELDSRVNASMDAMDAALTEAELTHELRTFPGVDHAFFNDTGGRYDEEQATAAYDAVIDWFGQHVA